VARKFKAFDAKTINEEFLALPFEDFKSLTHAMELFQDGQNFGYEVKHYQGDLMMIKGRGQGRCLWFSKERVFTAGGVETEILVALLVYKKESQEVPERILKTARERLKKYRELN